jgi:hypothetical protein
VTGLHKVKPVISLKLPKVAFAGVLVRMRKVNVDMTGLRDIFLTIRTQGHHMCVLSLLVVIDISACWKDTQGFIFWHTVILFLYWLWHPVVPLEIFNE